MLRWIFSSILVVSFAAAGTHTAAAQMPARAQTSSSPASNLNDPPPSPEEIRSRAKILLANQHANDRAIEEYERIERLSDRTAGINPRVLEDKEYRVVPNGFGTYKILLRQDGNRVSDADYRRELQRWEDVLELALNPSDSRAKDLDAKYEKKQHDRADMVDAMQDAFNPRWTGREIRNGHVCDVILLEPNPNFHPRSLLQDALTHVTVKIWVDCSTNQLVRGEASVIRDISVGGGIFGKLYRGGVFSMDQQEVAPGVWLPVRIQYDYTIRKFLFTSEEHQLMEASHYRRLGPPKDALDAVRSELAKSTLDRSDP
jgi:hypothetical protein